MSGSEQDRYVLHYKLLTRVQRTSQNVAFWQRPHQKNLSQDLQHPCRDHLRQRLPKQRFPVVKLWI